MTKPKPRTCDVMRRVTIPDVHVPFHDVRAFNGLLEFINREKPDGIDIIGDFIDCYGQSSKFDTDPARKHRLQDELNIAKTLFADIRNAAGGKCDIRFSEGNHEARIWKVTWGPARMLAGLTELEVPRLLGLQDHGITYYAPGSEYHVRNVWYAHGHLIRKQAGVSGRAIGDQIWGSVITGHTHRMGFVPYTSWTMTADAWEAGHLCDVTQIAYTQGHANWQSGWLMVHLAERWNQVETVKVLQGAGRKGSTKYVYRGQEFRL